MSFSETLIWVLVVAILLVAADALRRVMHDRRSKLRMKIDPRFLDVPEEDDNNILGPVRKVRDGVPRTAVPQQPPLIVDEPDDIDSDDELEEAPLETLEPAAEPVAQASVSTPAPEPVEVIRSETAAPARADKGAWPTAPRAGLLETAKKTFQRPTPPPTPEKDPPIVDVIVIHLLFPLGVNGEELLRALLEQGMRYGEMKIFHLHEKDSLMFSLANAHQPGYFNINDMESDTFKAVSLFEKLPGPVDPLGAFKRMVTVAQRLAERFDGELRDENRILLSQQMLDHLHERVQEFERQSRVPYGKR